MAPERLEREDGPDLDTTDRLDAFFAACDEREEGTEPDWADHRRTIQRSVTAGNTGT